jgi:hypothetical protein
MLNVAVNEACLTAMADGMRLQAWRAPQFASLDEQVKQINLLPSLKQALETERAWRWRVLENGPPIQFEKNPFVKMLPRGWTDQNIVVCANLFTNVIASVDPAGQIILPEKVIAGTREVESLSSHRSFYNCLAIVMIPNFTPAVLSTAHCQTRANQVLVALALERYRMAHGAYPDTLDALKPRFIATIPHDIIGGHPLHFHRADDGAFALYSVGWNGRDDGGLRGRSDEDNDWVWPLWCY